MIGGVGYALRHPLSGLARERSKEAAGMQEQSHEPRRIQLHLVLPYKFDPVQDHRVKAYLDRGYRIEQFQRITDREAIVTLSNEELAAS